MSLPRNIVYSRFKDLPWFNPISKSRIIIFGQGGIGSWLTLFTARTGASIITVDKDTVEQVNIAGQVYGKKEIGLPKVEAMKTVVERLCGESKITPLNTEVKVDEDSGWKSYLRIADVVCVSFDSIAARKIVYNAWKKEGKPISLFVDGRMGVENGQVFTVEKVSKTLTGPNVEYYEDSFFEDSSVEEAPCTMKATSHCGAMISTLMTAQITNWFNNQQSKVMPRTVVSQLDFHLPIMLFESKTIDVTKQEEHESEQRDKVVH